MLKLFIRIIRKCALDWWEKMYFTAYPLPAPVPLDNQFTIHWPRIPVSLKCHGGASSLCVGVIDPFGKEIGSLDTNSERVLVPLIETNLVRTRQSSTPKLSPNSISPKDGGQVRWQVLSKKEMLPFCIPAWGSGGWGLRNLRSPRGWCGISYVAEMVEIISSILLGGLLFDVPKVDNRQRRIVRRII